MIPLIVIVGPTAVGKTSISIQLAEQCNGEIVSADSRLFYRGMDIGTAKPTHDELDRVPHHLVDVAEPDQVWNLALFKRSAEMAIDNIYHRGKVSFLVGGTGQYIRALIEGWEIPEVVPDLQLRSALEAWAKVVGEIGLHQRLSVLDPEAATRIDPRNLRRTIRALEVILLTGRLFSSQRKHSPPHYRALVLGLMRPRTELYARVDKRIQEMLDNGFIGEVERLLDRGYSPDIPAFSAIGYCQIIEYLQGKCTMEEAVSEMKRITRQFIRRQANWFKLDDPSIQWFRVDTSTLKQMKTVISDFIQKNTKINLTY
jgi:tRNA dimethylallyltransferase